MTSKDYLSQEEIDALLRQSGDSDGDGGASDSSPVVPLIDDYLTPLEQDALGEIGNITFGSAATALSTLLGMKTDITTPKVSVIAKKELENEFPKPHVAVHVNYVDGFQGINLLVIKTRDAQVIADLMLGGTGNVEEGVELNEIHVSAVQEAMNQMMGSSATSMSTIFNRFVNISPPGIDIIDLANGEGTDKLPDEEVLIKVSFRLIIGDLIDSNLMQLLPVSFAKELIASLMGGAGMDSEPAPAPEAPKAAPAASQPAAQQAPVTPPAPPAAHDPYGQPGYQPPYPPYPPYPGYPQQPMYQQPPMMPPAPQHYGQPGYAAAAQRNVNVQQAQFSDFQGGPNIHADGTNLNLLLDIPLKVTVELGRTQKVIKDILELSQGSIIELDKLAGEPVDILVNNKLIAKGEVVVIDENFGVRVTDIVSQWDRLQKLQ
ncbi:flagellar motor switch phosphatase FliY [Paenibacillus turpanensis]|uniref:flagellar motor switch phosphatase FliY n=1 Tax=Paenibacillus turpanensis TaxID=2689078 RepID=UPI00140AF476|nr:flagellar motor switch phosphatase FliY [Paenibacillus turpanensis]